MSEADCDTCRFRVRHFDPEGCYKGLGRTSWFGKILTKMMGCFKYKSDADIHDKLINEYQSWVKLR
jgi:hypothetical protein